MTEKLNACPICDGTKFVEAFECPDHFLSKEVFALQKCSQCNTLLTNPRPDQKSIVTYYKSDSYISHSNQSNSLINIIYKKVRSITLRHKLKMLERFAFQGKLLDYGCGTGHFLSYASQHGWNVRGVEPDHTAREQIANNLSQYVTPSLTQLEDKDFDVVTLFHVLEHVHSLEETLSDIISRLNRNGVVFLALPNYQSADAKKYHTHWAGYDVPRHLYHFDQKSIFQLSKKYGLNIVSTIPMKFDSYYVSMLSEKYLGHSSPFLRGMINGYRSNRQAKQTREYSSLIYVLTQ
ncbi:MAG: methyltransferase domain-containing protein [Roseivirga sp.]